MTKMIKDAKYQALEALLKELSLEQEELSHLMLRHEGELCYISFCTPWQLYEAYVDLDTMEVLGLNFLPCTEASTGIDTICTKVA